VNKKNLLSFILFWHSWHLIFACSKSIFLLLIEYISSCILLFDLLYEIIFCFSWETPSS
jgi:hypothetical protein